MNIFNGHVGAVTAGHFTADGKLLSYPRSKYMDIKG